MHEEHEDGTPRTPAQLVLRIVTATVSAIMRSQVTMGPLFRSSAALILCGACALAPKPQTEPPFASCRNGTGVEWQSLADATDRATLDRWCDSVGPPLLIEGRDTSPAIAAMVVVSWNVHVGHGDTDALLEWIDRTLNVARPYAVVLLLQEAVRGGAAVPVTAPPGMEPPGAIRARSDTQDVATVAARLSMYAAYVPSMRNGGLVVAGAQQDRGNAI
jgi:hypothetical protein